MSSRSGTDAPLAPALAAALAGAVEADRRRAGRAIAGVAGDRVPVERLATCVLERLPDAEDPGPIIRTLATLRATDPAAVDAALDRHDASEGLRAAVAGVEPWAAGTVPDGGAATPVEPADRDPARGSGGPPAERSPTADAAGDASRGQRDPDPAALARRRRIERVESSAAFRAIARRSAYDLSVVAPEASGRYGSAVRVRAERDGERRGLALRLFDRPDGATEFDATLAECLDAWAAVGEHRGIRGPADWGGTPRPWVATPPVAGSLADRSPPDDGRALAEAEALADGLTACHRRGVVHGGVDPGNVVYLDGAVADRPRPHLDNVGVVDAVRQHADPTGALDPRYAAPEYFDRRFGRVDAASDVYGLGATLFRLVTGRPPVRGDYETVRTATLAGDLAVDDADLPAGFADVLARATAREKLHRYDTVAAMRADLRALQRR